MLELVQKSRVATRLFGRKYDFTWRYLLNFGPTVGYAMSPEPLTGECRRIVESLNRDGIGITSAGKLLRNIELFDSLRDATSKMLADRSREIEESRIAANTDSREEQKPFLLTLLGGHPKLEPESAYGRYALSREIITIAQAYFNMHVAMRYYNVWLNFHSSNGPTQSQLWHRDPEDRYILKVFTTLSNVDDGAGPFTYAPGTHPKGGVVRNPEFLYKDGKTPRSDDDQMAAVVPRDRWVRGIGDIGTIIFADTRGLHKGGQATQRDRLLFTCEFTSPNAGNGGVPAQRYARS
ncbi:MAG TPA: hypothetical protein VEX68_00225 [Bryobacteraceae bacterium]|nr:hypothetical protein [Bryobacteraceae bacterium]